MAMRDVKCICENCDCKAECEFFKETIEPCLEVVKVNLYDDSEPFVRCLINNLNDYECDYFEEKKN
jgi:hypothetical protein